MRKTTLSTIALCTVASLMTVRVPAAETTAVPPASKSAADPSEQSGDPVLAKGKGVEVKRSQLDEAVKGLKTKAAAQGQVVPPEQLAMVEPGLLEQLIQTQILLSKATDSEKAKAKEDAAGRVQEARTNAPSKEVFEAGIKAMGMTEDKLIKTMAEEGAAEAVLLRELKVNVTDVDVKKFYEDTNNAAKFEAPEMVRASHILLMTQDPKTNQELAQAEKDAKHKTMEGLLKRARAGEDFAKLAKEYSEDPGSKEKGGEYTFPRGQMMPEFEAAAFALKTNEVSDIVTTQYGYHIIKLSEHLPPHKVALDKVAPRIKNHLTQQELETKAPDYLAKAKKEAAVEILDPKLKRQDAPTGAPKESAK
jgi:peptidyl-prolyl cis-trans isomerase C